MTIWLTPEPRSGVFVVLSTFDGPAAASYLRCMATSILRAAALTALTSFAVPAVAAPEMRGEADRSAPGAPLPFFRRGDALPNLSGSGAGLPSDRPGLGTEGALDAPSLPHAAEPDAAASAPSSKAPSLAEMLDKLLNRLALARDADEAKGIAGLVEQLWMQSGSDTADLLMTRAVAAMDGQRRDVAAALLDKIIELRPGWAEAWNKRATLRFLEDDDSGAMEDISHVLVLEPRHFGALSGMGFILERHGDHAAALKALRKALAVDPQDAEIGKAVDKLVPTVDGESL